MTKVLQLASITPLAMGTVKAGDNADVGHSGYLVRIYNDGAGEWGSAWTNGSGDSVFYLIEGGYQYQVEKNGYNSGKQPMGGFNVTPGGDTTYTYTA